jgi:hypothetical protein
VLVAAETCVLPSDSIEAELPLTDRGEDWIDTNNNSSPLHIKTIVTYSNSN